MKSTLLASLFAGALAAGPVTAQTVDVGLTMSGGVLAVIYGQDCGPVTCTPAFGSVIAAGESRVLGHYSAPQSLYVIALGFPGPCGAIPGIDNVLLLSSPFVLGFGITSSPPFVPTPCQQGVASESFTIPIGAPSGVVIRAQSLGFSNSGVLAFGPAIEATIF